MLLMAAPFFEAARVSYGCALPGLRSARACASRRACIVYGFGLSASRFARIRSCRIIAEDVTDSSNRVNQRWLEALIDFVAKRVDVYVDDIADAVKMNVPDMFDNHRPCDRTIRIAQQEFQKCIFFHFKIDNLSGPPYLSGGRVHFEIGDAKPGVFLWTATE